MPINTYSTLELETYTPHILCVTLNRPAVRNALNTQMMLDLRDCFREFYVEQGDWRAIVISGQGEHAFCAGGDLKERNGMSDAQWRQQHAILEQMVQAVMDCPIPIIAAVNGSCFGGGLELALMADFIYAADTCRFGFPEGRLGIMPGACGTQNLVRACGQRRAKEIILSGLPFAAAEAKSWGIFNEVFSPQTLMEATLKTAAEVATTAPVSARQIKKSINVAVQSDLSTGYAFEIEAYNRTIPMQDRLEGVAAFNNKRPAKFTGE